MSKIVKAIGTLDRTATKEDITALAREHARQIIDQGYDLLKVYVELKRYEVYLSTIIKELKDATLEKAQERGQKNFDYASARITVGERARYHYEQDATWRRLNEELERIKEERKAREKMLKQVTEPLEVVNPETGEIEKIVAPLKEIVEQLMIRL